MSNGGDARAEEIIIVRRRSGGEDEGHHGGAWKIAFADFMTAMMAFFLVMWLINASNTETRAAVASYFNPIKLADNVARNKGIQDVDEKPNPKGAATSDTDGENQKDKDKEKGGKSAEGKAKAKDTAAGGVDSAFEERHRMALNLEKSSSSTKRDDGLGKSGTAAEAGRAFRDPFNPLAASRMLATETPPAAGEDVAIAVKKPKTAALDNPLATSEDPKADSAAKAPAPGSVAAPAAPGSPAEVAKDAAAKAASGGAAATEGSEAAQPGGAAAAKAAEGQAAKATAARVLRDVRTISEQLGATGGPGIDVAIEGDNVVLSLTDTSTFGMFGVGSADPNGQLVKLLEKITPVILANSNAIVVRGHTDARPFRLDAKNNNWRLSMSRAEAAYEVLLKSGVDEKRIERIEAHADRKLKVDSDPQAAGNRRIEILLRQAKT